MTLAPDHPVHRHALDLEGPARVSDHGLAIGNGLLGATVWGNGTPLNLSLDRGDLWDLRPVSEFSGEHYTWEEMARRHRDGRHEALKTQLETPYYRAGPTKIPAGRLEFEAGAPLLRSRLDRASMLAAAMFEGGGTVEAFISAVAPEGRLRGTGSRPAFNLAAAPFHAEPPGWVKPTGFTGSFNDVWELDYPPPFVFRSVEGSSFGQDGWSGFGFSVAIAWKETIKGWEAVWRIETRKAHESLEELATQTLADARKSLLTAFDDAFAPHAAWWADRWSRARVDLPDASLEKTYYTGLGLFDAACRLGAPPAPLQGPWTSDAGQLPPWKGDYHHDLNTQMTYWPAYAGDRLDASVGFLDWLWETRDACRAWTRQFFQTDGLNVPMTADLLNRQIGGWRQYTHSVSTSAWLAQHFYLHWRYSADDLFLRERAYPYLREVSEFIDQISQHRDAAGLRGVLLSSSPEIGDNKPEAWFDALTNYDLSLLCAALGWTAEMAVALGDTDEAFRWRRVAAEFPQLAIARDGCLLVAPGHPLKESHRHFSHAMALHPLGLLRPLDSEADIKIAEATLDQLDQLGASRWMGYSFAWRAAMLARAGRGDAALADLLAFENGFTFPNGFHSNGDWQGRGHSQAVFGAFTMEGNSAAVSAVHEMLLQSTPGSIRLFPAIPHEWRDVAFSGLRADGAVLVSARLRDSRIVEVRLLAEQPANFRFSSYDSPAFVDIELKPGELINLSTDQLDRLTNTSG